MQNPISLKICLSAILQEVAVDTDVIFFYVVASLLSPFGAKKFTSTRQVLFETKLEHWCFAVLIRVQSALMG